MGKMAVLINGEFREFEIAVQSWNFMNDIDCDFYVSTWSKCIQKNKNLNIHIEEEITEERIKKILPNANISISNINDYDFSFETSWHNAKQIFHWKNTVRMMKESGVQYDSVMMTRPDNYINCAFPSNDFLTMNEEKTLYGPLAIHVSGPDKQYFVLDFFFVGSMESISKMVETLPDRMDLNIHGELSRHILNLDMFVKPIQNFRQTVVRPSVRGIENVDINIVDEKYWEWGQNHFNWE
jgi:hypothetical protein